MNNEQRDFDKEAAGWDEQPGRVKLAGDVAEVILKRNVVKPEMDAMDFGCGTGLVTLRLQAHVRSIVGVDSAQGMLDVLNAKIARLKLDNVRTLRVDLDRGEALTGRYHLIVSSMTLHHIKDIASLFRAFHGVLAPGGYLCVADLDLEGGRFHEDNTGVFHFGFDRALLKRNLADTGFTDIQDTTATEVTKPTAGGEIRQFTVFLITACKKSNKPAEDR